MDSIVKRLIENHRVEESIDIDTLMSTGEDNVAGNLYNDFSIGTTIRISDKYGIITYKKIKGDNFQEYSCAGLYGESPRNFKVYDSESMAGIMMRAYDRGSHITIKEGGN